MYNKCALIKQSAACSLALATMRTSVFFAIALLVVASVHVARGLTDVEMCTQFKHYLEMARADGQQSASFDGSITEALKNSQWWQNLKNLC